MRAAPGCRRSATLTLLALAVSVTLALPGTAHAFTAYTQVAAGGGHSCGLVAGGAVKCWGEGTSGQLGNNTFQGSSVPVDVQGISAASWIAAGYQHSCVVVTGGAVRCWGEGTFGQLGNNPTGDSSVPVPVQGISDATAVTAGQFSSCALVAGGAVKCWGLGNHGQLGNNSVADSPVPVTVQGISGATAITTASGDYYVSDHSCALVAGGAVKCWGQGTSGELGNNSVADSPVPVTAHGISGAIAISAGGQHTCALVTGGAVKCWGEGTFGVLGNNSTASSPVPVTVNGISGASAIGAGGLHVCALVAAGTGQCWGLGFQGQMGNGLFDTEHLLPVNVQGVSGATTIASGARHSCALVAGGAVKCWGRGINGQLGNNATTDSPLPVDVLGSGTAPPMPSTTPPALTTPTVPPLQGKPPTVRQVTPLFATRASLRSGRIVGILLGIVISKGGTPGSVLRAECLETCGRHRSLAAVRVTRASGQRLKLRLAIRRGFVLRLVVTRSGMRPRYADFSFARTPRGLLPRRLRDGCFSSVGRPSVC